MLAAVTTIGAVVALATTLLPVLLAAWAALLSRPAFGALTRLLGGRKTLAALLLIVALLSALVPIGLLLVSIAGNVIAFVRQLVASDDARAVIQAYVGSQGAPGGLPGVERMLQLVKEHAGQALDVIHTVIGVGAGAAIRLFLTVFGMYFFLLDGHRAFEWAVRHSPLSRPHLERLCDAFVETGRGLFIGVFLTSLVQGAIATVTYAALGVPSAVTLGALTCVASVIPSFGTALVWVPVAAVLFLNGHRTEALVLALVGVFVIGMVDNVMRPLVSRWGRLSLPTFVLILSIFGGLATFGGAGLLLGPLLVRLAKEALDMAREVGLVGEAATRS